MPLMPLSDSQGACLLEMSFGQQTLPTKGFYRVFAEGPYIPVTQSTFLERIILRKM